MLPPGERIVTTPDDPAVSQALREAPRTGRCYLCHEIGAGRWYGYLWGPTVGRFLRLQEAEGRIAGCLHADDPVQMREILLSPTLGVTREAFAGVGVLLFMAFDRSAFRGARIVDSLWAADGEGDHHLVYKHGEPLRATEGLGDGSPPSLATCQAFMARLVEGSASLFEDVRQQTVGFYAEGRAALGGAP
jgi:hypothetical protein